MVKSAGMKALHGLFVGEPKAASLPADLNAQLITVGIQLVITDKRVIHILLKKF